MSRRIMVALGGLLVTVALLAGGLGVALAQMPDGWQSGGIMGETGMLGGGMMGGAGAMRGGSGMMGRGAELPPTGDAGRWFIEAMIPHHQDAVAMADLALTRATRPEITDLATAIKATQSAEIEQMRVWYRQWYGAEPQARPMPMQEVSDLTTLRGAADFDRAFVEAMVPHHQMAVMMATMALPRVEQAELRGLLRGIVTDQTAEIASMSAWYRTWYGAAPPAMGGGMMGGGMMAGGMMGSGMMAGCAG